MATTRGARPRCACVCSADDAVHRPNAATGSGAVIPPVALGVAAELRAAVPHAVPTSPDRDGDSRGNTSDDPADRIRLLSAVSRGCAYAGERGRGAHMA